jgi:ring-1,2-phenylacetyl-CoA epoxidase subunit PaaC
VNMKNLSKYYLQIADNALILSHRLSEYSSKAPFLEEDLANTNVALDLIGMAESIYVKIAENEKISISDDIVYKRKESDFLNCLLVEQNNEDYAHIIVRQFLMDNFHFHFFSELTESKDPFLKALALKSLKEVTYHLRRSSEWMIRLGDGTELANKKMQKAIDFLWKFVSELFEESEIDFEMKDKKIGVDLSIIKHLYFQKLREIFYMANLNIPKNDFKVIGGKQGKHTEELGHILCEMQFLPSKYPDAIW